MTDEPSSTPDFSGSGPVEYRPAPVVPASDAARVLAREEARLLAIEGVTSVGIGLGPPGLEALVVGVVDAGVAARLPPAIDGLPLMVTVTGTVDALSRR
jgi:hypothetical protein